VAERAPEVGSDAAGWAGNRLDLAAVMDGADGHFLDQIRDRERGVICVGAAEDPDQPLLERVKFAGIMGMLYSEFAMKRIGGLVPAAAVTVLPGLSALPELFLSCASSALTVGAQAWRCAAISRRMSGVKISCMASSIFPPGTTMMFGRDMNESCSIDSR
jgi:Polyphosphate kinase N-terminal domain